ncbi:type II secretion system protein [Thiomicrorhabdus heinhorstiae]|nr:prepilin-type N-terminal cleavage/methylation domain-containing protein [Thiomicrorhabdus heinhorstiae]
MEVRRCCAGFTLMELMVVVVILSWLVWPFLQGVQRVQFEAKRELTETRLSGVKQALLDFVRVNAFLPCPDGNGDGREDRDGMDQCEFTHGSVPYLDVFLPPLQLKDAFGGNFIYAVDQGVQNQVSLHDADNAASYFARNAAPRFNLQTPPNALQSAENGFVICEAAESGCSDIEAKLHSVSAVLLAVNRRGIGSSMVNCLSQSLWEEENCDGDRYLVFGVYSKDLFDDQLMVISSYEIKSELSAVWSIH